MWNRINLADGKYIRLHKELQQRYNKLGEFFHFSVDDGGGSARQVMAYLADKAASTKPALQLETEVRRLGAKASSVRKTQAGRRIEREMDRSFCIIL